MLRLLPPLTRSTSVPVSPDTVPPTLNVLVAQATVTLVTFAALTVPMPWATVQVWPEGWVRMVTLYWVAFAIALGKVNAPLTEIVRLSAPLFCNTTLPDSPETVPPTVKLAARQLTLTFETLAPLAVPVPLATEQTCPRGCVPTVTLKGLPFATRAGIVKLPFAEMPRSSPPLFWTISVPARPGTAPPMLTPDIPGLLDDGVDEVTAPPQETTSVAAAPIARAPTTLRMPMPISYRCPPLKLKALFDRNW